MSWDIQGRAQILAGCLGLIFVMLPREAVAVRIPATPIGGVPTNRSSPAGPASEQQTYCCSNGPVESWLLSKSMDNQKVGNLSAFCNDGNALPSVVMGYNGTRSNCSINLEDLPRQYGDLGYSIPYSASSTLDSLFEGNATISCEQGLVPIGFSVSSSCFGLANFQVLCGRPTADASCPANSILVPGAPLGTSQPLSIFLTPTIFVATNFSSPGATRCCGRGSIKEWYTASTADKSFVASIGAMCTDGSLLSNVSYGFNGSATISCATQFNNATLTANPIDNKFPFNSSLLLDSFLVAGNQTRQQSYIQCPNNMVAVGFRARRNCIGLTALQVVCGQPNSLAMPPAASTGPGTGSPAMIGPTTSSGASGLSGGAIAGIAIGAVAAIALAALLAFFVLRRRKRKPGPISSYKGGFEERPMDMGDPFGEGVPISSYKAQALQSPELDSYGSSETSSIPFPGIPDHEALNMDAVRLGTATDCSLANLPEDWKIPINQVELCIRNGKPIILGRGGFGLVYLGLIRREKAAIKVVIGGGLREQAKLLHEIEILERCRSSHIVQFLGYSLHNNQLLLAMAYQPKGTLYASLRQNPVYQYYNRGKEALESICIALVRLHSMHIAHLDLKTPNVLIAADGSVKVADIGLGKLVKGLDTPVTQFGTWAWTSPEQLINNRGSLKSDIWALGTIIHEVCTLEEPERQLRRDVSVPDEAPQEVADLVNLCRREKPEDRPTAEEALDILTHVSRTISGTTLRSNTSGTSVKSAHHSHPSQ